MEEVLAAFGERYAPMVRMEEERAMSAQKAKCHDPHPIPYNKTPPNNPSVISKAKKTKRP